MKDFTAVRVSFGLNGLILNCKDLPRYIQYITEFKSKGPHDSLMGVLLTRENEHGIKMFEEYRKYYTYRHNLMRHIGIQSSKGNIYSAKTSDCGDVLITGALMTREKYNWMCTEFSYPGCSKQDQHSIVESWQPHQLTDMLTEKNSMLYVGAVNQDCNQVCAAQNKKCIPQMLRYINWCVILKQYFDCSASCASYDFWMTYGIRSPASDLARKSCFAGDVQSLLMCEGKDEQMARLCPCS